MTVENKLYRKQKKEKTEECVALKICHNAGLQYPSLPHHLHFAVSTSW
jgi:hypothetical protein